jgi:aminoglycoside phosphotransferase
MTVLREPKAFVAPLGHKLTRADELRHVRRLDWRFLLPDPCLGDVGFLGHDDGLLAGALGREARSLTSIDTDTTAQFDVIVARCAPLASIPRALELLRPGGHLYWEVERRQQPLTTPGALLRRLRRAGFASAAIHWQRPSCRNAVDIVPLSASHLVAAVLQRRSGHASKRALAAAARLLQRVRLVDLAIPSWSALARKSGGAPLPSNAAVAFLDAQGAHSAGADTDPHRLHYRLRVPRFAASSHVIYLAHGPASTTPVLAVKVQRLVGDETALQDEASALAAVQAARPGGFGSIPRLVASAEWRGRRWMAQTALPGRTMSAAYVRRHAGECVTAVTAWLLELHQATRGAALGAGGVARLLAEPFETARHLVDGELLAALGAETLQRLGPEFATLPAVFEHGDLAAPNVLVTSSPSAGVGVVDWECAEPRGLAAVDLVFFLAFVAGARSGARTPAEHVAAYHRAFLAPKAWGRSQLASYAQGLDLPAVLLPALVAATWMRATSRAVMRSAGTSGHLVTATPDFARPLALWRHTLACFDALEF